MTIIKIEWRNLSNTKLETVACSVCGPVRWHHFLKVMLLSRSAENLYYSTIFCSLINPMGLRDMRNFFRKILQPHTSLEQVYWTILELQYKKKGGKKVISRSQ